MSERNEDEDEWQKRKRAWVEAGQAYEDEWQKMKRAWRDAMAQSSQVNAAPESNDPHRQDVQQLLTYIRAALDHLENGDEPEAERLLRSALITWENVP